MLLTILIIVLIFALIGTLPNYSYSSTWSYWPSGMAGFIVIILLIILLL